MAAAIAAPLHIDPAPAKSADFDYKRYQEKIKEYVVKVCLLVQGPQSCCMYMSSCANGCVITRGSYNKAAAANYSVPNSPHARRPNSPINRLSLLLAVRYALKYAHINPRLTCRPRASL